MEQIEGEAGVRGGPREPRSLVGGGGPSRVALRGRLSRSERGMVSAEWAVGIIAAVAVAGVLLSVVTSGPVEAAILKFILQVIRAFSGGLSRL